MGRPSKEYQAFVHLTDRLLAVPRETIQKRLEAYQKEAASRPGKRGPKPKATRRRASRDSGA